MILFAHSPPTQCHIGVIEQQETRVVNVGSGEG